MKKIAIAAAVTAALSAGVAQAYDLGTFSQALVVPNALHNGPADTTIVGLINETSAPTSVWWAFFDANSGHRVDGCVSMSAHDFAAFDLSAQKQAADVKGVRGYLVFAAVKENSGKYGACQRPAGEPDGGEKISANAFHVNTAAQDVAFIPVFPAKTGEPIFTDPSYGLDVTSANPATGGDKVYLRFFVDGAPGGNDTSIVIWSNGPIADGLPSKPLRLGFDAYDTEQNSVSGNLLLANSELNVLNPEAVDANGRKVVEGISGINDGFIVMTVPAGTDRQVVSYSLVSSTAFGAVQTLLNPVASITP